MDKMKKIRVMQFGSSSRLLGAERWILALIKHSDSKQVEHVVTTIKDSELDSNDLISNVSEMGLKSVLISARGPFDVRVLWKLSSLIKKERIDILHTHGYKTDIIGFIAAKISGIRIISTPHGWSKEKDLKLQIYESIARSFLRFFDYVVPLSEDLKDGLIKGGIRGNRIKLIENSVDISEVEDALKSNQKIVNTENIGHKSIGYIGQLILTVNFPLAQRLGLQEKPENTDPLSNRLELMTARWDLAVLWIPPLAGLLILLDHAWWPAACLIAGGVHFDAGGREWA